MFRTDLPKVPGALLKERYGVSAIEFAVAAPVLLLSVLTMTDVALAIKQRMNLDQATRAGAEYVLSGLSNTADVEQLVTAAATGDFSATHENLEGGSGPTVEVQSWCECTDAGEIVSCTGTVCGNAYPPAIYYELAASSTYDALFLPDFDVSSVIRVQTR
jgi:pilus assembly protein CpaE